jgi:uncharacterized protein (DUF2147 family)
MHHTGFIRFFRRAGAAAAAAALLAGHTAAQAPAPPDVTGVWIDHTGQGAVEIGPCSSLGSNMGNATGGNPARNRVCGRVVWLKNPEHKSVSGKRICGAQVLGDLRRDGRNVWNSGWIFNPEDEERFNAALELASADTLMVTGYLGVKFLGETFTWKRATTSLQTCVAGTPVR